MRTRKVNWGSLTTIAGLILLVGAEIFGAAFAGGWALGGILGLGNILTWTPMALFGLAGVWATAKLLQSALKVDPVMGSDNSTHQ